MEVPWLLFDADNTLWDTESLYDQARLRLCQFMENKGVEQEAADRFQRTRDGQLYAAYGYSACRFARSFEDTLLHFVSDAAPADVRSVREFAMNVFTTRATPVSGVGELLRQLASRYTLGLITAGEQWVQQRRLSEFEHSDAFAAIEVVERKDRAVFSDYCDRYGVPRDQSYAIGDSVRSDIEPALAAGLNAILVRANNWHVVEGHHNSAPAGVVAVNALSELKDHLM